MRAIRVLASVPLLLGMVACGNDDGSSAAMAAAARSFQDDLELAVSQPTPLGTVSALELIQVEGEEELEENAVRSPASARSSPAPARQTTSRPVASTTATAPTRVPVARTEVVRNTRRDAAIGAGAGAVIGAVAGGRDSRVRGAVIGAVLGGAAGAVVGHTIDTNTRVIYE